MPTHTHTHTHTPTHTHTHTHTHKDTHILLQRLHCTNESTWTGTSGMSVSKKLLNQPVKLVSGEVWEEIEKIGFILFSVHKMWVYGQRGRKTNIY